MRSVRVRANQSARKAHETRARLFSLRALSTALSLFCIPASSAFAFECDGSINNFKLCARCNTNNATNAATITAQVPSGTPSSGNTVTIPYTVPPAGGTVTYNFTVNTSVGNLFNNATPPVQNVTQTTQAVTVRNVATNTAIATASGTATRSVAVTASQSVALTQPTSNANYAYVGFTAQCVPNTVSGQLTLTQAVSPTTFSDVGQTLTHTFTVRNDTNVILTNVVVSAPDTVGLVCSPALPATLLVGQSSTCTATRSTTAPVAGQPCLTTPASASASTPTGGVVSATASAKACVTNEKTRAAISQFINRRVDLLASNEPDRARIMRRFEGRGAGGGAPVSVSGSADSDKGEFSVATSLNRLRQAKGASAGVNPDSERDSRMGLGSSLKDDQIGAGEPSSLDVWLEAHYQRFSDEEVSRKGDFGIAYLGADYLVTPGLLVGALVQLDWMSDFNRALTTEITGVGWMAGPYMSAKLSENLFFDARGAWGTSSNDITPFATYTDNFETERWLAKANLTGNWHLENLRISPSVGVIYVEETQKAYVDSVGLTIPEQNARVGRLTFGPEFGTEINLGGGDTLEPHISFTGMWDFDKSGQLNSNGLVTTNDDFRMKIEGGVTLRGETGASVRATASYDGIGSRDFSAWGGQLWLNVPIEALSDERLFAGLAPKCCDGMSYVGAGELVVAQAADVPPNPADAAGASAAASDTTLVAGDEPAYELPTVVVPTVKTPVVLPAKPKPKTAPVVEEEAVSPSSSKKAAKKAEPGGGSASAPTSGGAGGGSTAGGGTGDFEGGTGSGELIDLSGRAGQRIVEKVGSVDIVTAKDIERSGARTLDEAIDLVPGLYVRNAADGVPRIDIRGLRTRNITLLLDGVPLNSAVDGQFDPRAIPVENIAKIKITRGGSSVLYGPGGNAAVIDITTKSAAGGLHGSVQAEYSPERGTQERATASYGSKKFQMFMSASGLDQDHYDLSDDFTPTKQQSGEERVNSDRQDRALYTNMVWSPSQAAKFGLSVNYRTGEYGKPPATIARGDPTALPESLYVPRTRFERVDDYENISLQSSSWIKFNSRFSIRPLAYFNRLNEVTNNFDDATFSTQTKQQALHEDATTSIGGGGLQAIYGLNGNQFTLALDGHNEAWSANGFCIAGGGGGGGGGNCPGIANSRVDYDIHEEIQVFSAAAEQELALAPGVSAVFGAGYAQQRRDGRFDGDYTYLAGLRVDVTETTTLRGSVARKIRFPTLRDLFDISGGNPDLETEVTQNYEVGFEQKIPDLKAFVSVALFQIDATNFIERQNQVFTNIASLRFRGVETTAHYVGIENLDLSTGYTYLDSDNMDPESQSVAPGDTSRLQNRPTHKVTASASYRFDGGLTLSADYLFIAGSYALSSGGGPITALELDSYHVVNVGATQDIIGTSAQIFGRIDNVFDEDYAETLGFPQPGRTIFGGVRAKF